MTVSLGASPFTRGGRVWYTSHQRLVLQQSSSNEVDVNINSEVLIQQTGLDGGSSLKLNAIERYLQARSTTEKFARYYSYPLNARTRPTPIAPVQLVSYFPWPGYEYKMN